MKTLACDSMTGQFCLVTAEGKEIWSSTIWFKGGFCEAGSGGKAVPKDYREPLEGLPSVSKKTSNRTKPKKPKSPPKKVSEDDIISMDKFEYMAKRKNHFLNVKVVDIDEATQKYSVMTEKSSKTWLVDTLYLRPQRPPN